MLLLLLLFLIALDPPSNDLSLCFVVDGNAAGSSLEHAERMSPKLQSAHRLLMDLVHLASGDPPQFLHVHEELPKMIVVEMINSLLAEHHEFICSQILFVDVLRSQVSAAVRQVPTNLRRSLLQQC